MGSHAYRMPEENFSKRKREETLSAMVVGDRGRLGNREGPMLENALARTVGKVKTQHNAAGSVQKRPPQNATSTIRMGVNQNKN